MECQRFDSPPRAKWRRGSNIVYKTKEVALEAITSKKKGYDWNTHEWDWRIAPVYLDESEIEYIKDEAYYKWNTFKDCLQAATTEADYLKLYDEAIQESYNVRRTMICQMLYKIGCPERVYKMASLIEDDSSIKHYVGIWEILLKKYGKKD